MSTFFCPRWMRERKGNSLCLCCGYLVGSFGWWIVCYAGAAFLYMNAIKLRHSSGNKRISKRQTTIPMQFLRVVPFANLRFLQIRFIVILIFFSLIFVQTHNEFWMVVAKAMMRLNIKIARFFFAQTRARTHHSKPFSTRHWFSIDSIRNRCFYCCIIKHLHVFLSLVYIHISVYLHFVQHTVLFCVVDIIAHSVEDIIFNYISVQKHHDYFLTLAFKVVCILSLFHFEDWTLPWLHLQTWIMKCWILSEFNVLLSSN